MTAKTLSIAALLALGVLATDAAAELAVSADENKVVLVDGRSTVVQNPPPDTVSIIDLTDTGTRIKVNGGSAAIRTADK